MSAPAAIRTAASRKPRRFSARSNEHREVRPWRNEAVVQDVHDRVLALMSAGEECR